MAYAGYFGEPPERIAFFFPGRPEDFPRRFADIKLPELPLHRRDQSSRGTAVGENFALRF